MRYFTWRSELDASVIGLEYPQLQGFRHGVSEARKDAFYDSLSDRLGIPADPIARDLFVLSSRSKPTDVLSIAFDGHSLVVNERVKHILDGFQIMEHRWDAVEILHGKNNYLPYWWMRWSGDEEAEVDFERSDLMEYVISSNESKGPVHVRSHAELEQKYIEQDAIDPIGDLSVKAVRVVIRTEGLRSRDMFSLGRLDHRLFVSEALAVELLASHVSGVLLTPADHLTVH